MSFNVFTGRPSVFHPPALGGPGFDAPPAVDTTTFLALAGDSGYANLLTDLTVNSVTVAATAVYKGDGAGAASWTAAVGTDLAIVGAGTDPTLDALTPFTTSGEEGVTFANGKSYRCATTAFGDVGTDDFCIEAVLRLGQNSGAILNKYNSPTNDHGFALFQNTSSTIGLFMKNGTGSATVAGPSGTAATWVHVMAFVDRSGSTTDDWIVYVNGVAGTGASPANFVDAFASGGANSGISIGAANDATSLKSTATVAWVALWKSAAWFVGGGGNAAQWDAVAKDRFRRLCGLRASTATGTANPTTTTRSGAAYLDRVTTGSTRKMFFVGAQWIRYGSRPEVAGGDTLKGVIIEAQSTNLCLRSAEFDNASWTKTAATVSAASTADPALGTEADGIVADAVDTQHAVSQAVNLTAASYVFSVWAKAGNQNHLILEDTTVANCRAWFNLSTGAVGTVDAGVAEALCMPFGDGWFRCSIRYTGTVAAHTHRISPAAADNDVDFAGDASTVNVHLWGAQIEQTTHASSYIPTAAASASRTLDTLQYKMDDGNFTASSAGRLEAKILHPASRDLQAAHTVANISAASNSTADGVRLEAVAAGDAARAVMNTAGAAEYDVTGTTDVVDGEIHTLATSWATNEGKLLVDGAQEGATDASVTVPAAAPAALTVGMFNSTQATNSLIGSIRIKSSTT